MHETITYEPDMYLTNKDVKDIQEIFQTPLIGTYNWDYTAADDRINRLYQLAKKRQWNVEIDLDWSQPWNQEDLTLEDYAYNHQMFNDYKPYIRLSDEKKLEFQNKAAAWALAQFLHGEQGALLVSSQLCSCA
ncbi:MAG TPA: ferritin, partial [Gammaproteobacteria bacterium]|nr:ferritin [Gammaproteobacteria bacterium]